MIVNLLLNEQYTVGYNKAIITVIINCFEENKKVEVTYGS